MSESNADDQKPWQKPKQRVSEKTKVALLAVIEAARYVKKPNLQAIAIRCGVKYSTLKQTWYRWNKGLIDLGEPETAADREVETKVEMARTMQLCAKGEQFLNDQFEGVMVRVKQAAADGNPDAYFEFKVDRIVSAMLQLARLRETKEKGFLAMLEQAQASQRKSEPEKNVTTGKVIDIPARVARATDQQKLESAFSGA